MGAALAFIQPILALLKPFWKYIVGAAALIGLCWFTHIWYEGKLDAAYKRGVAVTESKDEAVRLRQERENQALVAELKTDAATAQAKLEGQIRENKLIADDLRTQLRAHRVCSDERSGRSVPGDSGPAEVVDGAAANAGPPKPDEENAFPTVGDDLAYIGEQCQVNTDKLITLQGYTADLMSKLRQLAEKSRGR
jgi:hypothetical protein